MTKSNSVDLGDENLPGEPGGEQLGAPAPKKETVKMFADSMPPDKQEREFTVKDAERLMKYEQARGKQLWKIADGQNYEFKDGRIRSTGTGTTGDVS